MAEKRIDQYTEKTDPLVNADYLLASDSEDLTGGVPKYKKIATNRVTRPEDVVNDLVTGGATVPLSAQQGVVLAGMSGVSNINLFDNAIINPIDENMVDQYGNDGNSLADSAYAMDRWKVNVGGVSNPTFNKGSDYIGLTTGGSGTGRFSLYQPIEDVNYKRIDGIGHVFWASVKSNASAIMQFYNGTSYFTSNTHTGGGSFETLSIVLTDANMTGLTGSVLCFIGVAGSNNTNISIGATDYFQFRKAKLEKGSSATSYQPRHYGEELALCQRYYVKMTFTTNDCICCGYQDGSTATYFAFSVPVKMRTTPSISVTQSPKIIYDGGSASTSSFNVRVQQGSILSMECTSSASYTGAIAIESDGTGTIFALSAEL